tara:strand:- start:1963 stop:2295 length:333 start_codon:yes stop_codon:yes gene_type:complete
MKWSYTNGKLNVSSEQREHQFLLKDLIQEVSKYKSFKKKMILFFIVLSIFLFGMQTYGAQFPSNQSIYFYIGYLLTPLVLAAFTSSILYLVLRRSPKEVRKLNKYFDKKV